MATILVVEDHVVTQRVLSKRLRDAGHEVSPATNGLEALALLKEGDVDLIISDIAMPEMDGLTLLRHIRSDERLAHIPVIMLTTSVLDLHRQEAMQAGANGFLEKPVSSWELEAMVKSRLQGKI
jgi:CheY-like chemotaxis protein